MAMTGWIRQYDPSRPIHNENAICEQGVGRMWDDNVHGTDVICPMYPSVEDIIEHAKHSDDPRPLILRIRTRYEIVAVTSKNTGTLSKPGTASKAGSSGNGKITVFELRPMASNIGLMEVILVKSVMISISSATACWRMALPTVPHRIQKLSSQSPLPG